MQSDSGAKDTLAVNSAQDPDEMLQRAELWARAHVTFAARHDRTGRHGIRWVAEIKVGDLVFEREEFGDHRKRDSLRERASDAVVRDFLDCTADMMRNDDAQALPF